uniref:Uncharacterized protein n=1 Tax=Arundo donax TaxID=35708 RepID=A0A0A9CG77_ARUDO
MLCGSAAQLHWHVDMAIGSCGCGSGRS